MRQINKILGFFLAVVFCMGLIFSTPITADASYTYRIKISLGNNENASFNEDAVSELAGSYSVDYASDENRTLVISNLVFGAKISLNVDELVDITSSTDETEYYVKGLRIAGEDVLVDGNTKVELSVDGDETYVVAYGVGATVPYTVKYQDADGNALLDDEILYGAVGEVVKVPARHIDGYKPDAYYKTNSSGLKEGTLNEDGTVSDGTVFTFVYTPNTGSVVYNEEYEYEYQYSSSYVTSGDGDTTVIRRSSSDDGTETTDTTNGTTTTGNTADSNDDATDDADDSDTSDATDNSESVSGDEPQEIIDIDDEDTALAGENEKDSYLRRMMYAIGVVIVAVIAILISLYLATRKSKSVVSAESKKQKKDK